MNASSIMARISPEPNTGCWLWTGAEKDRGYGAVGAQYAHRVVYEMMAGKIPAGLQLDHKCRVRCCVNPAHLEPVTGAVNTLRGAGGAALNARKTHCIRGHELSGKNLHVDPVGKRRCRKCANAARRERYLRDSQSPEYRQKDNAARRANYANNRERELARKHAAYVLRKSTAGRQETTCQSPPTS